MDGVQSITITTEPRQLQALFKLVQRAAMSDAEACFTEDLFSGWFAQVQDQRNQMQALARMATLANQQPPAPPSDVLTGDARRHQSTQESGPPDALGPLPYDGVERTIN